MPLEVIGLPDIPIPPPFEIATFVTVPLGSSPEGTQVHSLPVEINKSPIFAT